MPPRRAKPGALLDVDEICGRDKLIEEMWETLEQQSVRLEAEKRTGKSSILQLMAANPKPGWLVVSLGLLDVHSPDELADAVYAKLYPHFGRWGRAKFKAREFLTSLGGTEVGGVLKVPDGATRPKGYWKTLLKHTIQDLVECKGEEKVVLLFDEVSLMLQNLILRSDENTAMEVLDVLSHLRKDPQTGRGFRMVLTGSIGLPHVIARLKTAGFADQGVSAMESIPVPALDAADAVQLATDLIDGEALVAADKAKSAAALADVSDRIPFYTHRVAKWLAGRPGKNADPAVVDRAVGELLADEQDLLELRHFRSRIDNYYPDDKAAVVAILDMVARADTPLGLDEIAAAINTAVGPESGKLKDLLRLLVLDHYLARDGDSRYRFRYSLLKRWWRSDPL